MFENKKQVSKHTPITCLKGKEREGERKKERERERKVSKNNIKKQITTHDKRDQKMKKNDNPTFVKKVPSD